jgi:putative hemolysin
MIEIAFLFALILVNGVFAMSEIALVSSRRARLAQLAEAGNSGAARALELAKDPTRFLSTVQVGITSIGILSGAVGEAAIADRLRVVYASVPILAPYAPTLALVSMVVVLTYVALIFGELVPKRLGLTRPEKIAAFVAGPMSALAALGRPLVYLLSASTDLVLTMLRVSRSKAPAVTPEEIKILMTEGAQEGVFHQVERDLVANVLHLDERRVGAVLTPRSEVVVLDVEGTTAENHAALMAGPHAVLPLCRGGLDDVIGFVRVTDVLASMLRNESTGFEQLAAPPLFVPRTVTLMALLQQFKQTRLPVALVVDEFGSVVGLVSLTDVTAAIVGELPETGDDDPAFVPRADGSLLVDGGVEIDRLEDRLVVDGLIDDDQPDVHTLGGLAMALLGRVPKVGDVFDRAGQRFEIVDMDGNRVDRVLITPVAQTRRRDS